MTAITTSERPLTMPKKINVRAVYKNGSLTPLDYVDIEEGDIVSLTIEVEVERSEEERRKKSQSAAGDWDRQRESEVIRRALSSPRLSTNEWLEKVRKRKEKFRTRVTAKQILAARDADRR